MIEEKMLTVRDVAIILGVSEKEVLDLAENGTIPGYKVGGVYLRFKQDQVEQYKKNRKHLKSEVINTGKDSLASRAGDFFYFNDFYIFALIFAILLSYLVYRGL